MHVGVTLARSFGRPGISRRLRVVLATAALCALAPLGAAAASLPNHHQVEALFVIDHDGGQPRDEGDLLPYSTTFQKILGGCLIGPDALTMRAINLADQASAVGARHVTALMILKSIAIRVTWVEKRGCGTSTTWPRRDARTATSSSQ
jgi:hypothetical protein